MRYLFALFLLGCAQAPVTYRMDPSVEPYASMVLDGAAKWNALGAALVLDDTATRYVRCDNIPRALGHNDDTGIRINCGYMSNSLTDETTLRIRQEVFIHEFGHFLGLGHVEDKTAIMYGNMLGTLEFSQADLNEYERVR